MDIFDQITTKQGDIFDQLEAEDYTDTGAGGMAGPEQGFWSRMWNNLTSVADPQMAEEMSAGQFQGGMGVGEYAKTVGQYGANLGMGAVSFPAGALGAAGALVRGQGLQGAKKAKERVSKYFTPDETTIGKISPEVGPALEGVGRILGKPIELGGDVGEYIGGEEGRQAGELVAEGLMLAAPFAYKAVTNSTWYRSLSVPQRDLVVLTMDDMLKRGWTEAQVLKQYQVPTFRQAIQRTHQEKPFVTPPRDAFTPREPVGPGLPEPRFSYEDRMGLTSGEYPGRMAGPTERFSPALAADIQQVGQPALPQGQGFELGESTGPRQVIEMGQDIPYPSAPEIRGIGGPGTVETLAEGAPPTTYQPSRVAPYEPTEYTPPIKADEFLDTPTPDIFDEVGDLATTSRSPVAEARQSFPQTTIPGEGVSRFERGPMRTPQFPDIEGYGPGEMRGNKPTEINIGELNRRTTAKQRNTPEPDAPAPEWYEPDTIEVKPEGYKTPEGIEPLPVKQRQLGRREEGRFAPAIDNATLERVKKLPELPAKKFFAGGKIEFSAEPTAYTFNKLGDDAKELFQIPVRKADDATVREQFAYKAEIAKMKEGPPKGASKRIGTYFIGLDPKGRQMLKKQGMEIIDGSKLTDAEKNVVRWWNKKAEDFFVRINGMREEVGLEPMNKRENYITFLRDLDAYADAGIPIDKPGAVNDAMMNDDLHLRTIPFGFAKSRTNAIYPIETDFFNIAGKYGNTALRHINMTPPIAEGRELIGAFDEWDTQRLDKNLQQGDVTRWSLQDTHPQTFKFLQGYLDAAAGQKIEIFPPKVEKVMKELRKNITGATLSGNTRSALVQVTSLKESAVELGPKYFAEGVKRLFTGEGAKAVEQSNVLKGREMDVSVKEIMDAGGMKIPSQGAMRIPMKAVETASKAKRIGTKAGFWPLRKIDSMVARATWLGAYEKGKSLGIAGDNLVNYADDVTVMTQSSGNPIEISPIQRTEIGRMATTFQNFTINRYNFVKQNLLGIGTDKNVSWPKLLGYLLTLEAVGIVFEDLLNTQSPDPAPIGTFIRKTKETGNPLKGAVATGRDLVEQLPGMSGIRYGSGVGGAPVDFSRDVAGWFSDKPDWQKKTMLELMAKGAGVPGTAQIAKTKRGMDKGKPWYKAMWLTEKRSMKPPKQGKYQPR